MEDYDTFLLHRLSRLRRSDEEEHNKTPPSSSLIRFNGQPILPPLLSAKQREEMQQHRDAALKAAVHRKLKTDSRMAYVQTILHSVQLRKTPTLEELLQETEINTKSSYSHTTSGRSASQSNLFTGTKDSLSLSPPPGSKERDGASLPPLTSTTYSAFFASDVTRQQSYQEGCLTDQYYSLQESQPSHKSVSSGYVTYDNAENTTSVSGRIDAERESFGLSEGAYDNNSMDAFFLHNTSNTIVKMPDIISHPPVDGEELERSGLESSFCSNLIVVKDICCISPQEDLVICDHLSAEPCERSHLDGTEGEDKLPSTTEHDLNKDHSLDRTEDTVSSSQNSGGSDSLEISQTLSIHHSPTTELHIQHDPTESEPEEKHKHEAKPSEEPYRLSLQALLKKSQEYRRCQRMLRNQAKSAKIQERAREQTRARAKEQSLSDKENDEFPDKAAVTTEGKRAKERRGTSIPSVEMSPKKSLGNERMIESEFIEENLKSPSPCPSPLTGAGHTKERTRAEGETIFKNNMLNISQEVITEPKQQQLTSTEISSVQEAFYLTSCPAADHKRSEKYHTIPAPSFCRSPVHCKSSIRDVEALDGVNGALTSKKKVLANAGLNEGHEVEEVSPGHKNTPIAVPSTVKLVVEGDVACVSAKSSQHINELESNLSSLKVLISNLESTPTKNLKNQVQTESDTQSKFSFKHSCQSGCDYWEDKLRDDDDDGSDAEQDQRYGKWPRRQSFDNLRNMQLEDTGPEPSVSATDNVPLTGQVEQAEAVDISELRLVKSLATERAKEKGSRKEGFTKSYRQHGGGTKPTTKGILSATQRLRIPDAFRNVPSVSAASCKSSVLSDTSNRPTEGHDSTRSPSLNQSYNVDAPSGLWLLEGSESDSGSKGHQKHLTPESEGESQVSKVKRRLLMHVTEETPGRRADGSGGAGSVVSPDSSTPKDTWSSAAARWYEGHDGQEDKQEQLKQAHAAQVRALQDQHRRQQEELLQALAVRYRLLQSVSFPCSMAASRLGDALTFSPLSQPTSPLSERYRPLLFAAAKGFLARRLLRTERVAQLVRTVRDTHQFLQQSPGRGEMCSRQDLLLQERVTLQLRAARYEVHDIFFSLSARERMQLISWDRELARERELRRRSGQTGRPRGSTSLSTATQKSLERRRGTIKRQQEGTRELRRDLDTILDSLSSSRRKPNEDSSEQILRGSPRALAPRDPDDTPLIGPSEDP